MELTFLGTGAAMPTGSRFQTGFVIAEDGRGVLIDCGCGVLHRLQQSNIGYEAIDTVLLTHHHLDHVADLMPLAKARWLAGEEALTVVGPTGTRDLVEGLFEVHDYMADRLDLTIREIEAGTHEVNGFDIEAADTVHSMPCLAYRFDDRVTLSGDTEPSENVFDLADGSAVLVHECAFPDDVEVSNHTRPTELGKGLAAIEVGRVYLNHLYPHAIGREDALVEAVTAQWDGEVSVPDDLTTIRIS